MSNNRFIEKGSSKQGQLEDSKFPMSGLVLDVRIILIESGEIGGIYTLYVPPKKPFFRRFDFSDGAVNFPERAQQWWKSYKALNGNQGGYIHYIPCTDDGRLLKGNSHTIGDKGNMSIAKKLIQLLKSK